MKASDIKARRIADSIIKQGKGDKEIPKPEKVRIKDISAGRDPIPVPKDPRKTDK